MYVVGTGGSESSSDCKTPLLEPSLAFSSSAIAFAFSASSKPCCMKPSVIAMFSSKVILGSKPLLAKEFAIALVIITLSYGTDSGLLAAIIFVYITSILSRSIFEPLT